jgi:anthranilate synthase/aminodeoxychorismate synthase-like glutamine amidotransferase
MIDNYDSFTYNLVQYLRMIGEKVEVRRNDEITVDEIEKIAPDALVLSPGPCTPSQAGVCNEAVSKFTGKMPILGVCLGHQSVAEALGGKVIRARRLMHGKTSPILHDSKTIYNGLPSPFEAGRYHSLIVEENSLPDCLYVSARTPEGEVMGVRHRDHPVEGIQFHPESVLTPVGMKLLENFAKLIHVHRETHPSDAS